MFVFLSLPLCLSHFCSVEHYFGHLPPPPSCMPFPIKWPTTIQTQWTEIWNRKHTMCLVSLSISHSQTEGHRNREKSVKPYFIPLGNVSFNKHTHAWSQTLIVTHYLGAFVFWLCEYICVFDRVLVYTTIYNKIECPGFCMFKWIHNPNTMIAVQCKRK